MTDRRIRKGESPELHSRSNPLKRRQERVPSKRKIAANEILADIREGVTNRQLRDKYGFSQKGLWRAFGSLINANLLQIGELKGRLLPSDDIVNHGRTRRWPRGYPPGTLLVRDLDDSADRYGVVQDISAKGMSVAGLETLVGENKTFLIELDDLEEDASSFTFQAECKWTGLLEKENLPVAGFEITTISQRDVEQLQKLLRSLACDI